MKHKTNIGIYIENLGQKNLISFANELITYGTSNNLLRDASIFYDTPARNDQAIKCGFFNSTELWNFTGTLITFSIKTALSSMKIVNNFNMCYVFGLEEKINIFDLMKICGYSNVKCGSVSEETQKELFRLTGIKNRTIINPEDFYNEYQR